MTDAPSPRCSSGMAEAELKYVRQQIVNFVDSGAQDGEPITVTNGDLCRWFDRLEVASAYLRDAADSGAGTFGVAQGRSDRGETILEQSEKLDGTQVQTVRRTDGTEYLREHGLTMLELLIQAGYDASLPHPECFGGFSYLKLADILNLPLTSSVSSTDREGSK